MPDKLNCLVFGAGAIGTYVGGQLALHGHNVGFIERQAAAEKLSKHGIRLEIEGKQNDVLDPVIWTTIDEALQNGPFDVAIFAIKSYDTEAALSDITPRSDRLPPFLCLQNGVENEQMLETVLGAGKVIAGSVTSAVARRTIGDVVLERKRGMGIFAGHPLSFTLSTALDQAGISVRLYANALDMKWSKLLTNILVNASAAILDMSPKAILEHPKLFRLEIAQFREALSVMDALHIQVVDLPGTPVRALSLAVRNLPMSISRALLHSSLVKGRGGKMPSLYIDLQSGASQSEVDWLNGAVVRMGKAAGVPTPVNHALNETLLSIIANTISHESYRNKPDKLLSVAGLK